MKVSIGWSGESSSNVWQRADVTLEEVDFQELLQEYSIPVPENVSTASKFALMKAEAERLLSAHLVGLGVEDAEMVKKLSAKKRQILEKIYSE